MRDYLRFVFIGLVVAVYAVLVSRTYGAETQEATETAIRANMEQNMIACNEENMDKLLKLMSKEMPNRQRFIMTVDQFWSVSDTYNRVEDVEVLKNTAAPYGNTRYPYATAKIRQTTYYIREAEDSLAVRRNCADGQCDEADMRHLMAVAPRNETVEFEALFKHEGGQWKLVANVSEPVPPGSPPKYTRRKRSAF